MAEAFATDIAKSLLGKLGSFTVQEFCLAWGLEGEFARLEERLSAINAVLSDAEKQQSQNDKIRLWLQKLKEVLYDAEDVLDEFECETLRRQVVRTGGSTSRKLDLMTMEEENEEEIKPLHLQTVIFGVLPATQALPKQILQRSADSLQALMIANCPNIRELPEFVSNLNKLQKLSIRRCPRLSKRCRRGTGEDWLKIAHVPEMDVDDYDSDEETSD